jgi:hypothetical protein
VKFERTGDIRKTLNIGIREVLKSHKILLVEETDFVPGSIPKDIDIWGESFSLDIDNLLDLPDLVERSNDAIVKIFNFRGEFMIHDNTINERTYTEAWTGNYKYPDHMLESCLRFFIRKSQEIQFASTNRVK